MSGAPAITLPPRNGASPGWAHTLRQLWLRSPDDVEPMVNETAVRIRAGLLMLIPLAMAYTYYDVVYGTRWVVTGSRIEDTLEVTADGRILYLVEAVRRTYDFSLQSWLLLYVLYDMLVCMFPRTVKLSPVAWLASLLASQKPVLWKPLAPKRFAWSIGATMAALCWIFFNPEVFAGWVNALFMHELLPTTENYFPRWFAWSAVLMCLSFMWLEAVLGICVGCQIHALLVRLGVFKEPCEACQNLDFGEPGR